MWSSFQNYFSLAINGLIESVSRIQPFKSVAVYETADYIIAVLYSCSSKTTAPSISFSLLLVSFQQLAKY